MSLPSCTLWRRNSTISSHSMCRIQLWYSHCKSNLRICNPHLYMKIYETPKWTGWRPESITMWLTYELSSTNVKLQSCVHINILFCSAPLSWGKRCLGMIQEILVITYWVTVCVEPLQTHDIIFCLSCWQNAPQIKGGGIWWKLSDSIRQSNFFGLNTIIQNCYIKAVCSLS